MLEIQDLLFAFEAVASQRYISYPRNLSINSAQIERVSSVSVSMIGHSPAVSLVVVFSASPGVPETVSLLTGGRFSALGFLAGSLSLDGDGGAVFLISQVDLYSAVLSTSSNPQAFSSPTLILCSRAVLLFLSSRLVRKNRMTAAVDTIMNVPTAMPMLAPSIHGPLASSP